MFKKLVIRAIATVPLLVIAAAGQTLSLLHSFDGATDGFNNESFIAMTQGRDGNMYDQAAEQGSNNGGTVWKVTPAGTFSVVLPFAPPGTGSRTSAPVLGLDGNFYGTNQHAGAVGAGYVYKLTPGGVATDLHDFAYSATDGGFPQCPPFLGPDGNFYGFAYGVNPTELYKITASTGAYSVVTLSAPEGACALTLGNDGNFYGVGGGGTKDLGVVFKMTTAGKVTILHNFTGSGTDPEYPVGNLVQASDGNFYGVTGQSPTSLAGGVIYKITSAGALTVLHTFAADGSEGANFSAGLVAATDGNLYGVAQTGGTNNAGTIYKVTTAGVLSVVHDFENKSTDACNNWEPLAQRSDGTLYGVGTGCGTNDTGAIYVLKSTAFKPFIAVQNFRAHAGQTVDILGAGLTGAKGVTFGSVPATSFKVVSSTFMTAVVPADAITSDVSVTTATQSLSTQKTLKVAPTVTSFDPTSGAAGTVVTITGTGFTGATKVTFGGVVASTFTVSSVTQITATVPTGALTGTISITTPGGVGISTKEFTVN